MKTSNKILLGILATILLNIISGFVLLKTSLGPGGIGFGDTIVEGKGKLATLKLNVDDFKRIEIEHNFDVTLVQGAQFVEIKAEENITKHFRAIVEDEMLKLTAEKPFTLIPQKAIQLTIGFNQLEEINAYGGGKIISNKPLEINNLEIRAYGASKFNLPLQVNQLDLRLKAAGSAKLAGTVTNAKIESYGMSRVQADQLIIENADIEASNFSKIDLQVTENLSIETKGNAVVEYSGQPTLYKTIGAKHQIIKK